MEKIVNIEKIVGHYGSKSIISTDNDARRIIEGDYSPSMMWDWYSSIKEEIRLHGNSIYAEIALRDILRKLTDHVSEMDDNDYQKKEIIADVISTCDSRKSKDEVYHYLVERGMEHINATGFNYVCVTGDMGSIYKELRNKYGDKLKER